MLEINAELDPFIESLAYRGSGVARHEGMVIFVAGAATGERVHARITRVHRKYSEAVVLAVLTPSPDRIAPCCLQPGGARTPGCVYDHIAYPAEISAKQKQLEDFFRRLPGGKEIQFSPPFASPAELHYRNKIVLHAQRPRDDLASTPTFGYLGDDNRTVLDITACPLAHPDINTALAAFRHTSVFANLKHGQSVTFRHTTHDGVLSWVDDAAPKTPEYLTESAPFGAMLVPPDGFYQVNPAVANALVLQVQEWFAADGGSGAEVLDLYCGVGVFAIACAKVGASRARGIEAGRRSIEAATANAYEHDVLAKFRSQTVEAAASDGFGSNLAQITVIVDPPRQGLAPEVARALADARARRLLYVSCDPATLARDLAILLAGPYVLRAARLFDMFPRTTHFETLVWLERKP